MKGRRYETYSGAALLAVVGLLLGSFAVIAGCTDKSEADPLASGKASYEAYCESCHGAEGTGLGELSGDMTTIPANLTDLSYRNAGTYPVEQVYKIIDGREMIPEHGTRAMPVWGNIWGYEGDTPVDHEVVEQRINELVEYIRTLQNS